jgi:hypothetical protein
MRIEDIGPNFAEDISEVERTILLQQLPALLKQRLRDETITGISVSKYPSSFRETQRRTHPNYTYRVYCTCEQGTKQVMVGKDLEHGWVTVKIPPAALTPSHRKTSLQ